METIPDEGDSWPGAMRTAHLNGGCRAINPPGATVEIRPHTISRKGIQFKSKQYRAFYTDLQTLGLQVLGVEFITHVFQVDGREPPEWRAYYPGGSTGWLPVDAAQTWAELAHAAYGLKSGRLWDVARRIVHQLRTCNWRLRQVSEEYADQLNALTLKGEFEVGRRTSNEYSWRCYLAIQSFLMDACVLRDYLAEFLAQFHAAPTGRMKAIKVTTLGGLLRNLTLRDDDDDVAIRTVRAAASHGGWLKELGDYRDLVVHSAPLTGPGFGLYTITTQHPLPDGQYLPGIRCPIPNEPATIFAARAAGEYFKDFEAQIQSFSRAVWSETQSRDGLSYSHETLGRLAELAKLLVTVSPIAPKQISIADSDIIGEIKITREP